MRETLQEFGSIINRAINLAKLKHGDEWLQTMRRQLPGGAFALLLAYIALADDEGTVQGSRPIPDADMAAEFGRSIATVQKWRNILAAHGYISQSKTPGGWIVTLKK